MRRRDFMKRVLVAGEVGEEQDVGGFDRRLGLPVAIIDMRRYDDSARAIPPHLVGAVAGMNAIIVDDEVSTGGTLTEAAEYLIQKGAKRVSAVATHPIFVGPAIQRIADSPLEEVIVTNTVPVYASDDSVSVALADPSDLETIDALQHLLNGNVKVLVASPDDIESALKRYYGRAGDSGAKMLQVIT